MTLRTTQDNWASHQITCAVIQLHSYYILRAIITKTKLKQRHHNRKRPRDTTRATNLHCTTAGKRLNSYFVFRTVGLVLHNNIRKAMAIAWPITALGAFSWAYWALVIGGGARAYHSICRERRHRSRAARLSIVAIVLSERRTRGAATNSRYYRIDNINRSWNSWTIADNDTVVIVSRVRLCLLLCSVERTEFFFLSRVKRRHPGAGLTPTCQWALHEVKTNKLSCVNFQNSGRQTGIRSLRSNLPVSMNSRESIEVYKFPQRNFERGKRRYNWICI